MIDNWRDAAVDVGYLLAALSFVLGLRFLSQPSTARKGNQLAALGMAIAIVATAINPDIELPGRGYSMTNMVLLVIALAIGAVASSLLARRVPMTSMPQMVALFNGMGGATAVFVGLGEFPHAGDDSRGVLLTIALGVIIGSVSAAGSAVAYLKLEERISGRPISLPWIRPAAIGAGVAAIVLGAGVVILQEGAFAGTLLWVLMAAALVVGVMTVLPIGGADMPVVIAILNSLTGIAAALTGLVLDNQALVVAGILVGASGSLLTLLMARAMNRSVSNVLFGAFGQISATAVGEGGPGEQQQVRATNVDDVSVSLAYAQRVIIVPGYGLAVAQAQHAVRELADVLEDRGVDVRYAIHPVAGRMPGHMNVLLAEANVPYDDLYEMEQINDDFAQTDVTLVIGANDVTNPAARTNPASPIFGMPILNVDQSKQVIVLKRGMAPGFAGIENELFSAPNTSMLFGNAKDTLNELVSAVKMA